jgi:hemoglobin-like flavoprotein
VDISQSLDRILSAPDTLGDRFYEIFLTEYPEARQYFEGVDLQRQGVVLTMALALVAQYYSNSYPATAKYLRYLGSKHHDRQIPLPLYAKWADAMLQTLEQFHGDDWDDHLSRQWQEAITLSAQRMTEGYDEHLTV